MRNGVSFKMSAQPPKQATFDGKTEGQRLQAILGTSEAKNGGKEQNDTATAAAK